MNDSRTLAALGLPPEATDTQIADRLRSLARLPAGSANPELWMRLLEGIELARQGSPAGPRGPSGDPALLANSVVEHAIVPPGEPGEERFGTAPWDRELGVDFAQADDRLRRLVAVEIGPRMSAAGLYELK